MSTTKPYLVRAIHEWCTDQGFTPYLSVAVDATTRVPREFVKNGEIVLNVGHDATHLLNLGNEEITFQARFGGRPYPVAVPIERVLAIYARENGQGMAFEISDVPVTRESSESGEEGATVALVDGDAEAATVLTPLENTPASKLDTVPSTSPQRPFLTRVK